MTGSPFTQDQILAAVNRYQNAGQPQPPVAAEASAPAPAPAAPVTPPETTITAEPTPAAPPAPVDPAQQYQQASDAYANEAAAAPQAQEQQNSLMAAAAQKHAEDVQAADARYADELENHQLATRAAEQEARALGEKAGAMRIVDRRTTGQKVMGLFALALSGVGDAMAQMGGNRDTHQAADMVKMLNEQVQRDYEKQRQEIQDVKDQAASKWSEAAISRQHYGDTLHARDAHLGLLKAKYAATTEQIAQASANPVLQQQGKLAAAKLRAESAELLMKAHDARTLEIQREMAAEKRARIAAGAGGRGGAGGGLYSPQQILAMGDAGQPMPEKLRGEYVKLSNLRNSTGRGEASAADQAARNAANPVQAAREQGARLSEDLVVKDPSVAVYHAKDPGKLQSLIDSRRNIIGLIDQAIQLRKDNPVKSHIWGSDARGELESIGTNIKLEAKNVFELGALSGPDTALIAGIAGDPAGLLDINEAKLKQLKASLQTSTRTALTKRGFEVPPGFEGAETRVEKAAGKAGASGVKMISEADLE